MKILCTTDGSPESLAVLPNLKDLASQSLSTIRFLTVIPEAEINRRSGAMAYSPSAATAFGGQQAKLQRLPADEDGAGRDQLYETARTEALQQLAQIAEPFQREGIAVETDVIFANDVADAIVDAAREGEFDLVAMATHGWSGLSALVQGSVAAGVIKGGGFPVLVVRPPARE
jgi:nucleotide-binding universal stress UspA family protein